LLDFHLIEAPARGGGEKPGGKGAMMAVFTQRPEKVKLA